MKMKATENNMSTDPNDKLSRNWMKIAAFSLLVSSVILLVAFLVSYFTFIRVVPCSKLAGNNLFVDSVVELFSEHLPPDSYFFPIAESKSGFLSDWSFYLLAFSCVGFFSFASVTYVDGSMILENKSWLAELQAQGLINNFSSLKNLKIKTKAGEIVISKSNMRYKIVLPKLEEHDLTRYGLVPEDNFLTCLCSKKELTGILHIFLSKVN